MRKIAFFTVVAFLGLVLSSCAGGSSKSAFGPYSEAENFYKQEKYPKAIEKYQEYLSKDPQGNLAAIAEYYVAKSYLELGSTADARESFEQVVEQFPGTSWAEFSKEHLESLKGSLQS